MNDTDTSMTKAPAGPALTDDEVRAALGRVDLFRAVAPGDMATLAASLRYREVEAGAAIVEEGGPGDAFYVVARGSVEVVGGAGEHRVILAALGPGQFFGEMALVTGEPRSATVIAADGCAVLELGRDAFAHLLASTPALRAGVDRVVAERQARGLRPFENEAYTVFTFDTPAGAARIGRGRDCAVVLDHPAVSNHHAELRRSEAGFRIADLGSAEGTYVGTEFVKERPLGDGETFWIGPFQLFLRGAELRLFQPALGIQLEARGLGRTVGHGKVLLAGVDLALNPGELTAIVGPSGAGKTTLLHLLLGVDVPSEGSVSYDGLPLAENADRFRRSLGYVPQNDIIHNELTVRESLRFAARLRLSGDISDEEVERLTHRSLEQVHLAHVADNLVSQLSGGQRKRACTAVELLSEPRILFLDEPTSGLDPGLDEQMMRQFRELADGGRTVVLTTHATRNVRLCDRVVVVCGGRLVFFGSPDELLAHFGVTDIAEIYGLLDRDQSAALEARFAVSPQRQSLDARLRRSTTVRAHASAHAAHARRHPVRQFLALVRRDVTVLVRDRVNLVLRVLGAPLLALALLMTFDRSIFSLELADGGNARQAVTFLYLGGIICLFLSAFTAANVITREGAIFRRERLLGLSPVSYVLAKVGILGVFALVQCALVVAVFRVGMDFPSPVGRTLLEIFGTLSLASFAGMTMGLALSALSPNGDRAAILVIMAVIPQLVFAGATVPRSEMSTASSIISQVTISKWEVELLGMSTGLDARVAAQRERQVPIEGGGSTRYIVEDPFAHAFSGGETARWLVLAGFGVGFTALTVVVQGRKGARKS